MLVTVLAGNARQLTAALLDVVLASANGGFFVVADMLPATAPLGVAAAATFLFERSAAEDVSALPGFSARRSSGFRRASSALPSPWRHDPPRPSVASLVYRLDCAFPPAATIVATTPA
ncbi:MAG TPA: hypothetical protein VE270_00295 [Thermoleophilaceae bacterium]|nr:hypothetical protein [Thermoleophilaceae bacterium]